MSGSAAVTSRAPQYVTLGELLVHPLRYFDRSRRGAGSFALYDMAAFGRGSPQVTAGRALRGRLAMVRTGDVLLSRAMSEPRRAWVVVEPAAHTALASAEWLVVRSNAHDPGYLRHLLVSNEFHLRLQQALAGRRQASAASPRLRSLALALPPHPQQQAIARLLDLADALRAKRRRALAAMDVLEVAWQEAEFAQRRLAVEALRAAMVVSRARFDALLAVLRDRAFLAQLTPA